MRLIFSLSPSSSSFLQVYPRQLLLPVSKLQPPPFTHQHGGENGKTNSYITDSSHIRKDTIVWNVGDPKGFPLITPSSVVVLIKPRCLLYRLARFILRQLCTPGTDLSAVRAQMPLAKKALSHRAPHNPESSWLFKGTQAEAGLCLVSLDWSRFLEIKSCDDTWWPSSELSLKSSCHRVEV